MKVAPVSTNMKLLRSRPQRGLILVAGGATPGSDAGTAQSPGGAAYLQHVAPTELGGWR